MSLFQILAADGENHFIFRNGLYQRLIVKGHQKPLCNGYLEKHDKALHKIAIMSTTKDGVNYHLVSAKTANQKERHEYLVKRAILDLFDIYGWEVKQ